MADMNESQESTPIWPRGAKVFMGCWAVVMMIVGCGGILGGLVALMISGPVGGVRLNGKPVETLGEKLVVLAGSIGFAIVGYIFRPRAKKNET